MSADNTPTNQPASVPGGTVEPAKRAAVAKERFQTPIDEPGERYELRDPMAEVTYRSNKVEEIIAKAEQLGGTRFTAIDADGRRTTVQRVNNEWQRGPQRPGTPQPSPNVVNERDEVPDVAEAAKASRSASGSEPKSPARSGAVDASAIARIDAQAERAALVARLEAALNDRYIIKRAMVTVGDKPVGQTEYRFRGDTSRLAFTESTFRLATDTNSPSVARSMVDVAESRNWQALRVSGHEDFRRMVWLEASVRGVKTIGYEPVPGDLELLRKERTARQVNRIEPTEAASADKASARGSGGRKTVLAAIEAVLVAQRVPETRREAILAAAADKLAQRTRDGRAPKVKLYDKPAPSRQPAVVPVRELQRTRDRAAPVR
jgi:Large polyvalent protein-associated domain 7